MTEKTELPALASSDSDSSQLAPQDAFNTKETLAAVSIAESVGRSAGVSDTDQDSNRNPFSDPDTAAYYATLYEKSQYECRHVFDPTLEWSPAEERKLVRKLDWHVCLWAVSLFSF
jgi:hypothetical protein